MKCTSIRIDIQSNTELYVTCGWAEPNSCWKLTRQHKVSSSNYIVEWTINHDIIEKDRAMTDHDSREWELREWLLK